MSQQRNVLQVKEQDKNPKEELSEVEISNLPDKDDPRIQEKIKWIEWEDGSF